MLLQSSGLEPAAINVSLNLPPDLYLMRSTGIDMDINYRYTMPPVKDSSRMDISLNNQFLQSFNLSSKQEANRLLLRIPVLQGLLDGKTDVSIPALKLGATSVTLCSTTLPRRRSRFWTHSVSKPISLGCEVCLPLLCGCKFRRFRI